MPTARICSRAVSFSRIRMRLAPAAAGRASRRSSLESDTIYATMILRPLLSVILLWALLKLPGGNQALLLTGIGVVVLLGLPGEFRKLRVGLVARRGKLAREYSASFLKFAPWLITLTYVSWVILVSAIIPPQWRVAVTAIAFVESLPRWIFKVSDSFAAARLQASESNRQSGSSLAP